jgi:predicted nucleic acid-binding Zn ribbon protein
MDCPNCGVYNPEGRQVCWRCDQELPKPKEPKKRSPGMTTARVWLMVGLGLLLWILLTWLLPMLLRSPAGPTPVP